MSLTWSWAVGNWHGGPDWELSSIKNRSLKIVLNDVSSASFTVPGDHVDATHITDLVTDLSVSCNGVDIHRGRATNTVDTIGPTSYDLTVTTTDYLGLLDRRLMLDGDKVYTAVEQSSIVSDLLSYAQGTPVPGMGPPGKVNGSLGITIDPAWPTTGVLRTQTFTAGSSVWAAIKSLIALDGGFDLSLSNILVATLTYPAAGVDKGVTLAYPGNLTQVTGTTDQATYLNVISQTGGVLAGVAAVPPSSIATASDISTRPEGRWELALTTPDLTDATSVAAAASYYLQRYGDRLQTAWQLVLAPGTWAGPAMLWPGDVVTVSIHRGRRWVDQELRVYELDIALDQNDVETVTTTVGTVVPNDRSVIRNLAKKLNYLAKL